MHLKKTYFVSSLVLIFGIHLNATVVAFMKASPANPLESTPAWEWVVKVLSFPLAIWWNGESLQTLVIACIINSALWAAAITLMGALWFSRGKTIENHNPGT